MLPTAHYSVGLASGLVVYKATGAHELGLVAAAMTHLPLDWLVDEYWTWRDDDRIDMAKLLTPIGIIAGILTVWLSLRGGSWPTDWTGHALGWWPLLWGLGGLLPDVIDLAVKWVTSKIGLGVVRSGWRLSGIEIFPCHYYSPWYWGQAYPRMLTYQGTLLAEYLVSVPALLCAWTAM